MRKTLKVRRYKVGYEIHYEEVSGEEAGGGATFTMRSAYTPAGDYLGDVKMARYLIIKMGIKPEKSDESHCVCSIGFCEGKQKWYGWSHRAIAGFGIGDKLFEEHCEGATDETPFIQHGTVTIEILDQARQAAVAFAKYVS